MRLIDADALKDLILQRFDMPDLYLLAHIIHLIDETQTADAVPVVRCRDCKYWQGSDDKDIGECVFIPTYISCQWDYCSNAVKRDTTHSFMSEWAKEIDEQLGKLTIRKEDKD